MSDVAPATRSGRSSPRTRFGLRAKLTASHLFVGVTISLLTLITAHLLEARDSQIDAVRTETVRGSTELASTVNSAFEEAFSAIVMHAPENHREFSLRIRLVAEERDRLLGRADLTAEESAALRDLDPILARAAQQGEAMLADLDAGKEPDPARVVAFDGAMDRLRDRSYDIAELITRRAKDDDARSRVVWDVALLGVGVAACLLALALGRVLGGRIAEPIVRLRDAARAFERGEFPRLETAGEDEIGELARAFDHTTASVRRLVGELTQRNADNRLLLDNVGQGLFTLDAAGLVSPEHSAALERWFGAPAPFESIGAFLGRVDPTFGALANVAFDQVVADILPIECTLPQMPVHLRKGGRHYRFAYEQIAPAGEPWRFLVVVTDVTSDIQRDAAEKGGRELLLLFERLLADRSGVVGFLEEASVLVEQIAVPEGMAAGLRALHTLKGNAAVFGLESVAALCHELEDIVERRGDWLADAEIDRLSAVWSHVTTTLSGVLGRAGGVVELTKAEHRALVDAARRRAPHPVLEAMLADVTLEPTARPLGRFADQARALATRLGKSVEIEVEDHGVRLDESHWATFWSAFVHAIKNAVDHGLEAPEARVAAGKPERGRLSLRTREVDDALRVELEDDGRGLDFEAIRAKCVAAGLPSDRDQDLLAALLAGGISTAVEVTDLSGRGVGLSAFAEICAELGGTVELESRRGQGTLLRASFPIVAKIATARSA